MSSIQRNYAIQHIHVFDPKNPWKKTNYMALKGHNSITLRAAAFSNEAFPPGIISPRGGRCIQSVGSSIKEPQLSLQDLLIPLRLQFSLIATDRGVDLKYKDI